MKQFIRFKSLVLITAITLFSFSCNRNDDVDSSSVKNDKNIIEIGQETTETSAFFNTWVQSDAGLVAALSDVNETYTVFAPSNGAFGKLLSTLDTFDSIEDFDTVEEKALLASILKYHIVEGEAIMSSDLKDSQMITTLQSENVIVGVIGNSITIKDKQSEEVNAAIVWMPDVLASNGVVHSIDQVLLPQSAIDSINNSYTLTYMYDVVAANDSLSILEAAIAKIGSNNDGWPSSNNDMNTVFAPTDDAFIALFDILGDDYNGLDDFETGTELIALESLLSQHIIAGTNVKAADLVAGSIEIGTLFDDSIEIIASDGTFVIGDMSGTNANIIAADLMAFNGVVHTIDKVLLTKKTIELLNFSLNLDLN